jgi:hypothetical protein
MMKIKQRNTEEPSEMEKAWKLTETLSRSPRKSDVTNRNAFSVLVILEIKRIIDRSKNGSNTFGQVWKGSQL